MLGGFLWKVNLYSLSKNTFQVFPSSSLLSPLFRAEIPVLVQVTKGGKWLTMERLAALSSLVN